MISRISHQKGLTLIELMIGATLGLTLSLTIMTAVINSNEMNREGMKAIELTENGRFLNEILKNDIANAGYYGALSDIPTGGTSPDPCDLDILNDTVAFPLQVYNDTTDTDLASKTTCNLKVVPNTDVLVIRRANSVEEDPASLPTEYNIQTTYNDYLIQKSTDASLYPYTNKAETEEIRRFLVHIYYVSPCRESDCSSSSATDTPTLKRLELRDGEFTSVAISEGIEQLQFEFGIDRSENGIPNESFSGADDAYVTEPTDEEIQNTVTVKFYALVRSNDKSNDLTDSNLYDLGRFGFVSGTTLGENFKRRVFMNLTRVHNIAIKRES
ncbi:PilW family protein [Litoribrevibacter euphylliae]|uniref:PilW family protein n=1 Tax=Litoribrevibacter euphylliae TaxID=1834034 RepID=A0ABV7HCK7_9GAMM